MADLKKYHVNIYVFGQTTRIVEAKSEEEAKRMVQKMLLAQDRQTPLAKMLMAYTWDYPHLSAWDMEPRPKENPGESIPEEA